jgi:hypothetical protein
MGISDKDYGRAIKDLQEIKAQVVKQMKENSVVNTTGSYNTTVGTSVGIGTGGFTINSDQPYGQFKVLTEKDLKHDAMKAPLSALIDMWTVRWGSEWVGETEFQEDDFWRIALVRLTGANKLEKHNLANQYMSVYRIIE